MKLEINGKTYFTTKIPKYFRLIKMLEMLLQNNRNTKSYHGIIHKGKKGILVCGIGCQGIRNFQLFYPIKDIYYYFDKYQKRLGKHGNGDYQT